QNGLFKPYGISPEQYNVLRILKGQEGEPITVSSIQDRMINKMSNASRLVEKLKTKGLIKRTECSKDRRQVDIVITDNGLELLKNLKAQVELDNKKSINLNTDEIEQLNSLLDKLRG